jgi:hypothetical protein
LKSSSPAQQLPAINALVAPTLLNNNNNNNNNNALAARHDIRVTDISYTQDRAVEEFTAGSPQRRIVARVVVDWRLGQHGHVLNLRLAQGRAVGGDQDHLGLAVAQGLGGALVAQDGLA